MHPSLDVVIKVLQSSVKVSPVVISPQAALETMLPLSISKIVIYLSVLAVMRKVPDLSKVTQQKSWLPEDFYFSGFFSKTLHLKVKSDTVINLSCPATSP